MNLVKVNDTPIFHNGQYYDVGDEFVCSDEELVLLSLYATVLDENYQEYVPHSETEPTVDEPVADEPTVDEPEAAAEKPKRTKKA